MHTVRTNLISPDGVPGNDGTENLVVKSRFLFYMEIGRYHKNQLVSTRIVEPIIYVSNNFALSFMLHAD
jgi:hypothetical protein